jgi:hypothetical protein
MSTDFLTFFRDPVRENLSPRTQNRQFTETFTFSEGKRPSIPEDNKSESYDAHSKKQVPIIPLH